VIEILKYSILVVKIVSFGSRAYIALCLVQTKPTMHTLIYTERKKSYAQYVLMKTELTRTYFLNSKVSEYYVYYNVIYVYVKP